VKSRPPVDPPGALRLHYNENTAGCSTAVLDAIRKLTPADLATYPEYTETLRVVGEWLGVPASQVMLTNGLDEGLLLVAQHAGWHTGAENDRSVPEFVIPEPAFEEFAGFSQVVRARVVRVEPEQDFVFPLERVLSAIGPATRVVYLIDPNNPTGLPLPRAAAETIATAAPAALVFVDEAYADFSGHTLVGPVLNRFPNIVIGRTFAKGHGLAGLRIGALVAAEATIDRLRRLQPMFSVNTVALRALEAALQDRAFLAASVASAATSREMVFAFCRGRGITYWPGVGNFVLMRLGPDVANIAKALADRGILARDKSAAPGCAGCLRVTTGVVEHTEHFLKALEDILATRTN
jgi:histidinol-phosphate aminotransferase